MNMYVCVSVCIVHVQYTSIYLRMFVYIQSTKCTCVPTYGHIGHTTDKYMHTVNIR